MILQWSNISEVCSMHRVTRIIVDYFEGKKLYVVNFISKVYIIR